MQLRLSPLMKRLHGIAIAVLLPLAVHAATYTFTDTSDFSSLVDGTAYTWGINSSYDTTGNTLAALESAIHSGSQHISTVTLTLTGISDWTTETKDVLYVDILNGLSNGANSTSYYSYSGADDTSYGTDPFNSGSTANTELIGTSNHVGFISPNTAPANDPSGTYSSALIAASSVSSAGGWTGNTGDPGTFSAYNTTSTYTITYTLSNANDTLLATLLGNDATGGATAGDVLGLGLGPDCHFNLGGISLSINTVPENGMTLVMLGIALVALAGYARNSRTSARV